MFNQFKTAILMTLVLTLITGLIYPSAITFLAQIIFPYQANGSLITHKNKIVGSKLISQDFTQAKYFHPRLSVVNHNADKSGGSNLGPTNKKLIERIRFDWKKLKLENPNKSVPFDLITTSASGLDPHITPEAAVFQAPQIARLRKLEEEEILKLINKHIEPKKLGILGEKRVNVLELNLALDKS